MKTAPLNSARASVRWPRHGLAGVSSGPCNRPVSHPVRRWLAGLCIGTAMAMAGCGGHGDDAPAAVAPPAVTPTFAVTGEVIQSSSYSASRLAALPQLTQDVSFQTSTAPQTHQYTGPTLWSVLNDAGLQQDASVKNDMLNRYVLATGSDGYRVAYGLGEISPGFGNRADLVAIGETVNGVTSPLSSDGYFRVTSPGDAKGGRYLSALQSLDVRRSGSTVTATGGGVASSLNVLGDGALHVGSFDQAALAALPQTTVTVGSNTYTGVDLWTLISSSSVGLNTNPAVHNDALSYLVVATGTDGYKALLTVGELDPAFGNTPALIALKANGSDLGSKGFARLVVPNDVMAGRWVSNLAALEILRAP